ncbi:MAG: hypothetical protein EOM28_11265 [Clostridia bacterium]|nr:hypothetical protein [Clostridia bacterium]
MSHDKDKLAEKILVFLYSLSSSSRVVNTNTFKRYVYLYYLTESFLNGVADNISISLDKGGIKIINFDSILDDLSVKEFITLNENNIVICDTLTDFVKALLSNTEGAFFAMHKQISPFVNLLKSYNDQFVFTIFFSEPTFKEATQRGLSVLDSNSSKLTILLDQFKKKLKNTKIDEYDILTYWMDFILKNYYTYEETNNDAEEC